MAGDNDDRTLFIGNLHNNVTEDVLYELFFQAGPIERVSIIPMKNNCFGYGFVTYKHESSVEYAIELFRGIKLFKKELNIKKRLPKQSSEVRCVDFQDQLHNLQVLAQNLNQNSQMVDFSNFPWGNQSNRNKPYNFDSRNHMLRPQERNQRKNRNHGNKDYHGRKGRSKD